MSPVHHVMFDVDGTLVQSNDIDGELFCAAVAEETELTVDTDWRRYHHITDSGILYQLVSAAGEIDRYAEISQRVERNFYARVNQYLTQNAIVEIDGAAHLIEKLLARGDVAVSIATGGWGRTARLKLAAAGLSFPLLPFASCNDHYRRAEIMQIAARRASVGHIIPCTYFGDGVWDKMACTELGFEFVLVGNAIEHPRRIDDYSDSASIMTLLGLPAAG